jgi:Flp pilus assembly protein CpaB
MITDDVRAESGRRETHGPSRGPVLTVRRRLPGGRAIVGGLLVALAAVGAIVLSTSGSGPAVVDVVVAGVEISPGTRLSADVLRVESLALPAELLEGTFDDPEELAGTVSKSSLSPGELLQHGDVVEATAAQRAAAPSREFSLHLDADRVGGGQLESGDRIDVVATYGGGDDAYTVVVLRDAPVIASRSNDDAIGSSRGVTLTLGLSTRADTVALAHAVDVAQLSIVRTTTSETDDDDPGIYRPEAGASGTDEADDDEEEDR